LEIALIREASSKRDSGVDDFGYTTKDGHCVVSERVLDLLIASGVKHCKKVELEN